MVIGIAVDHVGSVSSVKGAVTILGLMTLVPILMRFTMKQRGQRWERVLYAALLLLVGMALGTGVIFSQTMLIEEE